ncbi:MAG TPA: heavy metal-associated domain-containing protein [Pyrinomonadaceae bacterium]|nr:heavy metal-associated domain-containing protein [Pyrinomonadaceae bacterium]
MSKEQTTVTAPDMVCGGCANAIKNAFGRVDGVTNIEVDVATKRVSVEHEPTVTRDDIVRVLDDAGFPVEQ